MSSRAGDEMDDHSAGHGKGHCQEAIAELRALGDSARVVVSEQDDEVDALYDEIFSTMQEEMKAEPEKVASCTHLIFAAKNLERMADYATRIAKTVHYVTSGQPVNKATLRAAGTAVSAE